MTFRLAREEGLFAGTSTGANVIAALRLAEQLGPRATIVTVLCDTGMKYLRTYGARLDKPRRMGNTYSAAAMASAIRSIACCSASLPGRRPLTRMEKARVRPLAAVK